MMRRRSDTEFSFAPSGLADFPSATHGLRPFGRLRAGCGLHSFSRCAAGGDGRRTLFELNSN